MLTWIASFISSSQNSDSIDFGVGSFYALPSFWNNYDKTVIYKEARCKLEGNNIVIIDQQNSALSQVFQLSTRLNITSYQIFSKQLINGFKWNNVLKIQTLVKDYVCFEFSRWQDARNFHTEVVVRMHEMIYPGVKPDPISLKELISEEGLIYSNTIDEEDTNKKAKNTLEARSPHAQNTQKLGFSSVFQFEESKSPQIQSPEVLIESISPLYSPDSILYVSVCNLLEYMKDTEDCKLRLPNIHFYLIKTDKYLHHIDLIQHGRLFKRINLDTALNFHIVLSENKFMWIETCSDCSIKCWVCILVENISSLQALIHRSIYENTNQKSFNDLKEKEKHWIESINLLDISTIQPDPQPELESGWGESIFIEHYETYIHETKQSMTNSVVYVARGTSLGVYNISYERVSQLTDIPIVRSLSGEEFIPRNLLPYKQDTHLLMLNPYDKFKIYDLDIERETVVEEYRIDKDVEASFLFPVSKFASRTPQPNFLALNSKGIYCIDPRVPRAFKSVESKTYSSLTHFKCASSTAEGNFVVGSDNGQIRLYSKTGLKAKSLIKGLGDPITSIDITKEGDWIVATTSRYLLVIPLGTENSSGFSKPLSRISAKKLSISPEDMIKYDMTEIRFTGAVFSTGEHSRENFIITSSGNFLVIFNFSSIKRNSLFDYKIKQFKEKILSCEFKYGTESSAVLTMPSQIILQGR